MNKNNFLGVVLTTLIFMAGNLQAQLNLNVEGSGTISEKLGIGNDNPIRSLDIKADNFLSLVRLQNESLNGYSVIDFFGSDGGQVIGFGYANPNAAFLPGTAYLNTGPNIPFVMKNNGGTTRLQINPAGTMDLQGGDVTIADNLGFNTNMPQSQLHIKQTSGGEEGGIRLEQATNTNYWTMGSDGNDLRFRYNGVEKGYVDNGTAGFVNGSDKKLKKDITSFRPVLEKVMNLRPATYYYKDVVNPERKAWGFIAQEVEEVFPEMVYQNTDYKGLCYAEFAVLSIKAIQELNDKIGKDKLNTKVVEQELLSQNELLHKKVTQLEDQLATIQNLDILLEKANAIEAKLAAFEKMETKIKQLGNDLNSCCQSQDNLEISGENQTEIVLAEKTAQLEQNQPNPFNGTTIIKYYLPKWAYDAQLQITDINGKILKVENELSTGHGTVTLIAQTLPRGTYAYSLLVDGQIVETKRMVLVK